MMALDMINLLRSRDVRLSVRGEALVIDAPKGAVGPDEIAALQSRKSEIVRLLTNHVVKPADQKRALDDAAGWQERLMYRRELNCNASYPGLTCNGLAAGQVLNDYHFALMAADPPDPRRCAGCGEAIEYNARLDLGDGAHVHDRDGNVCLIAYGKKWRIRAAERLKSLGIVTPNSVVALQ